MSEVYHIHRYANSNLDQVTCMFVASTDVHVALQLSEGQSAVELHAPSRVVHLRGTFLSA